MKRLTIGAFLAFGCAQGQNVECHQYFDPDPDTRRFVEPAVARWSRATGCDIAIKAGGIPIMNVPSITMPDGRYVGGITVFDNWCGVKEIQISDLSPDPFRTAVHEIGHVIGRSCLRDDSGHSATGVMSSSIGQKKIDESSLTLICGVLECDEFRPEVEE